MKRFLLLLLCLAGLNGFVKAQELYVFTEPASNMPAKSIGIRLTNEGMFNGGFPSRSIAEGMLGLNKNLMLHVQGFFSDMDGKYRMEGGSFYAKYRFLSVDEVKSHFRMSAFGRLSTSKRSLYTRDINLEGDNSGWQAGVILTQLIHKLALASTLGYAQTFDKLDGAPNKQFSYSLSSGYLLFPITYKNYSQPNINLYLEVLGKTDAVDGRSALDLAPAVQVVLNSRTRIDLGYRFEVAGNILNRYNKNMYLARVEFNFFNILK